MKRYGLIVLLVVVLAWIAVAIARSSPSLGLLAAGALLGPARISPACLPATSEHTATLPVAGTGASVEVSPDFARLGRLRPQRAPGAAAGRLPGRGASFCQDPLRRRRAGARARGDRRGAAAAGRVHFRVDDPDPTEGAAVSDLAAPPADDQTFATLPGAQAPILDVTSGDRDPAAGDILITNGPVPDSTGR